MVVAARREERARGLELRLVPGLGIALSALLIADAGEGQDDLRLEVDDGEEGLRGQVARRPLGPPTRTHGEHRLHARRRGPLGRQPSHLRGRRDPPPVLPPAGGPGRSGSRGQRPRETRPLSLRPNKDSRTWYTVSLTLLLKWQGDPLKLVEAAGYDAPTLLQTVRKQTVRKEPGFPFLRGPKISALWVRMLRDNVGLELKHMERMPIPTDIHIVRATFTTGVLKGRFFGSVAQATALVEDAWREALGGVPLDPLDIDEPLWHLSKYGCSQRPKDRCQPTDCPRYNLCPVTTFCVPSKVLVSMQQAEIAT